MTLTPLAMLTPPAVASAEDAPSQEEGSEEDAAFELMKQGFVHFNERSYAEAIATWKQSFAAYPTGIAQLNIARAYGELNDFEKAREASRIARGESSKTLQLPLNRMELIQLSELELELVKKEEAFKEEEATRILEERRRACMAHATRLATPGKVGLGVIGAGLVSLGGTAFLAARARRQLSALTPPHTQGEDAFNEQADAFETSQRRAKITLGVGTGLVLLGGGLFGYDMTTLEYQDEGCDTLMRDPAHDPFTASSSPRLTLGISSFTVKF